MKKLLGIVVLGTLLSCSEYSDKKKIEKCADPKSIKEGAIVMKQAGKDVVLFRQDFVQDPDPLRIYGKDSLVRMSKMSLKDKISNERYESIWDSCEKEFVFTPVKFKEKYLK